MLATVTAVVLVLAASILLWRDDGATETTSLADPDSSDELIEPAPTAPSAPSTSAPATSTTLPGRDADPELLAVVDELQAFVTSVRGHEFRGRVDTRVLGDDEFDALLRDRLGLDDAVLATEAARLLTLGLITQEEAETYPEDRLAALKGVAGLYVGDEGIALRDTGGAGYDAAFRRVLVHELTHALDDQVFDTTRNRDDFRLDSEASTTLAMVTEGNADRVEARWVEAQPPEIRAELGPTGRPGRDALGDLETIIDHQLLAPYYLGWSFVGHVTATAGETAIDAQLRDPAPTTEQLYDLEAFDRGEGRVDVPAPPLPPGRELLDEGPAGVHFWYGILRYSVAEIPTDVVEQAITGWGGDWVVRWIEDDGIVCQRTDVVGDTVADTRELREAIWSWADATDGRVAVSDAAGRIRVEFCVPVPPTGASRA